MLRDLLAPDDLASRLEATAPLAVEAEGGGAALVALYGAPTGAPFWLLRPMPEGLWASMAAEHQAPHRGNVGD
jgi:hypothetical protein